MRGSAEIIRRMYEALEPVITLDNIHESVLKLTKNNKDLAKLVKDKSLKVIDIRHDSEALKVMATPAMDVITKMLDALGQTPMIPDGIDYEGILLDVIYDAEDELLTLCWNESMLEGDWTFIKDGLSGPEFQPCTGERGGWLVRGPEKMCLSVAMENVLAGYIHLIDYWVNRFTKTLYLNTTTEEWAQVFQIDLDDKTAVAEMTTHIRYVLMGE